MTPAEGTFAAAAGPRLDPLDEQTTDIRGACRMFTCSESHIRRLLASNALPGVIRMGKLIRFHVPTLKRHIAELAAGK